MAEGPMDKTARHVFWNSFFEELHKYAAMKPFKIPKISKHKVPPTGAARAARDGSSGMNRSRIQGSSGATQLTGQVAPIQNPVPVGRTGVNAQSTPMPKVPQPPR